MPNTPPPLLSPTVTCTYLGFVIRRDGTPIAMLAVRDERQLLKAGFREGATADLTLLSPPPDIALPTDGSAAPTG